MPPLPPRPPTLQSLHVQAQLGEKTSQPDQLTFQARNLLENAFLKYLGPYYSTIWLFQVASTYWYLSLL